ncbi:aquaporin-like protein [Pelagophyceae sp. CCMP2097]|nr:aquaporin-like protein [Pelagophyceae sp. CCMP2097]|mmetsp:Transcript_27868/g.93750  ORF Transcript_27868/g.93750 Transcript_27868/m.93750 type:complete len:332 (-) Transcript_27868:85-1080(-)
MVKAVPVRQDDVSVHNSMESGIDFGTDLLDLGDLGEASGETDPLEGALKVKRDPKFRRALIAEAVGTGMIVLFGCGTVCSTLSGAFSGIWQVAVVWGIGVALAISATAGISGAHLNPAVTLAFQLVRPSLGWRKSRLYMVAQLFGAICGGALNLAIYSGTITAFERSRGITRGSPESILSASAFGEYFPNPGLTLNHGGVYRQDDVTAAHACFVEGWGTFVLCFVIFALTHPNNAVPETAGSRVVVPLLIGGTVSLLLALYAPITQAGWNPARDFGPRLVAACAGWGSVAIPGPRGGFWIYIVGPFIGGPLGAAFAEFLLWGGLAEDGYFQ